MEPVNPMIEVFENDKLSELFHAVVDEHNVMIKSTEE